jgi:hypothetical protein
MLTRAAGSCLPRAPFPDGDRDVNNPGSCCRKVTRVQAIVCILRAIVWWALCGTERATEIGGEIVAAERGVAQSMNCPK